MGSDPEPHQNQILVRIRIKMNDNSSETLEESITKDPKKIVFRKPLYSATKKSRVNCVPTKERSNGIVSILRLFRQEHNFFFDVSHTIYPQFLGSGILKFAEHYFLGVLGSRLRIPISNREFVLRIPEMR
jgi:hypothetical protein